MQIFGKTWRLPSRETSALLLTLIVGAALLMAACGGGGDSNDGADEPADTPVARATAADGTASEEEGISAPDSVDIDESVWHAGFKVTLGTATYDPDTNSVEIDATFENLAVETASFNSQVVIETPDGAYDTKAIASDYPNVPGGQKTNGTIAIVVEDGFSFDDATLVIGNAQNNQAQVPLGPGGDGLVTLEPIALDVTGDVTAGAVTLHVESAELRADIPNVHQEVKKGYRLLIVRFAATPQPGIAIGQGVLFNENVFLKLPDGTSVSVRPDGNSGPIELLQGREGTTIRDLIARFEVPEPIDGAYAFALKGKYGPGGADVLGELTFAVESSAVVAAASATAATPATN